MSALNKNEIPPIDVRSGRSWAQPSPKNILIDDTHALMSLKDFNSLCDYSWSVPTGVYPGKMWRSTFGNQAFYLRWYSEVENDLCHLNQRIIIIA
jgi:hypothetical protein